jgi:hypothetical protein
MQDEHAMIRLLIQQRGLEGMRQTEVGAIRLE